MKKYLVAPILPALMVACGGGGSAPIPAPPTAPPPVTPGLVIQTGFHASQPQPTLARTSPSAIINTSMVELDLCIAGNQGGTLVGGYSRLPYQFVPNTIDDHTVAFDPSTTDPSTGATIGANGVSQTFLAGDPSIITPNDLSGSATFDAAAQGGVTPGIFLARFAPDASTTITLTPQHTTLTQIDEIVVRLGNPSYGLIDGSGHTATLISSPHLFYSGARYSAEDGNLAVPGGGDQALTGIGNIQYVLFVPASMIGANANYIVFGPDTVIDPVTNDLANPGTGSWDRNPPRLWQAKDTTAWITDPGCSGLVNAIQYFITNWPSAQGNPPAFATLAQYFQNYFIKFYAADSTMFNNPNPGTLGILGNSSHSASFEIIALDDSLGPISLAGNYTVNLVYQPLNSAYDLTSNVLTLAGQPPINLGCSVVAH